jgi:hypothetical protein
MAGKEKNACCFHSPENTEYMKRNNPAEPRREIISNYNISMQEKAIANIFRVADQKRSAIISTRSGQNSTPKRYFYVIRGHYGPETGERVYPSVS